MPSRTMKVRQQTLRCDSVMTNFGPKYTVGQLTVFLINAKFEFISIPHCPESVAPDPHLVR